MLPSVEFRLPDVPVMLTAPEDRAAYLSLHYWDYYDFADTSLISRPDITEQALVDFIGMLPYSPEAPAAIDTLYQRAGHSKEMLTHFIELGDKYLYEPNSPLHNEELYILFLQAWSHHPGLDETEKLRPRHRLEMALKNRPGEVATDFSVMDRQGRRIRLSQLKAEYVVVFFNDPECDDCRYTKAVLEASAVVGEAVAKGRLSVLSVCVEGKTAAWEQAHYPSTWYNGYDAGQRLTREEVYDLKAMPTLYLLDARKRVVLKDASVSAIEERLNLR